MNNDTKKRPNLKVPGVLFLIIIVPVLWIMLNKTGVHYSKKLPIYFERELGENGDTIYHTIDNFKLQNQNGDSVTLKNFEGKLLLVNFFFAKCETVCPAMNRFIAQHIYQEFEKDSAIRFISFSVDPENDSPKALLQYAKDYRANYPQWQFLTGSKNKIYNLAMESFKIPGSEDAHQGLFHSNKIVLVDKELRVRGVFETGGQNDKSQIIDAVRALKLEYKKNETH
ncbi:MAG: SCO family protein [Bacteroidota bacterium]